MRLRRGIAFLLSILCFIGISEYAIVEAYPLLETIVSVEDTENSKEDILGKKISIRSIIKSSKEEVIVSWDKVEGATYQLLINDKIIDVEENYITNKQIVNKEYFYKVRYKINDQFSMWSDSKSFIYEDSELKINNKQLELLPFISGSVYGINEGKEEWHNLSSEGGKIYSVSLDSPIRKLKLTLNNRVKDLEIQYRAFILEDNKWTEWVNENEEVGQVDKTISAIDIRYSEDREQKAFVKYSTIDIENVESPYYNNAEVYESPESLEPIKGIKLYMDTDYQVLESDETWKEGSTKDIKGFYEIPEGRTLTIEPNVKINFSNDIGEKAGFIVKGNLVIKGSSDKKVEILSQINDMDIDVKYTGSLIANDIVIKSNELSDNSIVNAFGNLELRNYELLSTNTKVVSTGVIFDQDRFNNRKNSNSIKLGKITNLKQGIYINTTQDGVLISDNTIENNIKGIVVDSNEYTKSDNFIDIKNNSIKDNESGIIINQYSYLKDKTYKSINIEANSIVDNSIRGIGLFVDSLSNIKINKNTISGTNIKKDKKDETGNELIGGPIVLEKAVIDEDSNDLLESINSDTNKNILTGNNYDTLILDRVSLAETAQVTIKKGSYTLLINDYLKTYRNTVLNINAGCDLVLRGGKESIINIKGILNFDGNLDDEITLFSISNSDIQTVGELNQNDKIANKINIEEKASLLGKGVYVKGLNITNGSFIQVAKNAMCTVKDFTISKVNADYILRTNADSSLISNFNIDGDSTKGIFIESNNSIVEKSNISNVFTYGINIKGDNTIVKSVNINNVKVSSKIHSTGIETASQINGTLISNCNISGVLFGVSTYGSKEVKFPVIIEGSTVNGDVYGVAINDCRFNLFVDNLTYNKSVSPYTNALVQITGSEISGYYSIFTGTQNVGNVNLVLMYNKLISKSYLRQQPTLMYNYGARNTACLYLGDGTRGQCTAVRNSFIESNTKSYFINFRFRTSSWSPINFVENAFGMSNSNGDINWNTKDIYSLIQGTENTYELLNNRQYYDVSKYGINTNIDISTIIDKIINDNQYLIRKLFGQEGVSSSSGNFSFNRTDLALDSAGIDFIFRRTYNSMNTEPSILGKGWSLGYESNFKKKDQDGQTIITVQLPNGSAETYLLNDNKYKALDSRNRLDFSEESKQYILNDNAGSKYIFREDGKLIEQYDKYKNKVTFSYDSQNRISQISDEVGRKYTFNYGVSNKITVTESIDNKSNRSFTYNLNSRGQLESITNFDGKIIEKYTYNNESGKLTGVDSIEKNGENSCIDTVNYNAEGKVDTYIESTGRITKYVYDPENKQTTIGIGKKLESGEYVIDKSQVSQVENYDRNGLVHYRSYSDGTYESQAFNYSYVQKFKQPNGSEIDEKILVLELLEEKDREGRLFKYEYDVYGNVNKITNPDDTVISYKYDENGNLLNETNEEGITKTYTYKNNVLESETVNIEQEGIKDSNGNVIKNSVATYEPYTKGNTNLKGLIGKKINPDGSYVEYNYDKYGYLSETIDEGKSSNKDKNTHVTKYNGQGLLEEEYVKAASLGDSEVKTIYIYDKFGNLKEKSYNGVSKETNIYDGYQRVEKSIDPMGQAKGIGTKYVYYPGTTLVHKQIDVKGNETTVVYDNRGRVVETIHPNGRIDKLKYDDLDRIIQKSYKDNSDSEEILLESISYTNSNGNTNIVTKRYIDKDRYIVEVVDKNWRGNDTKVVDGDGNVRSFTYIKTGDVKTETAADGGFKQYNYNSRGLLKSEYSKKLNDGTNTLYEAKLYKYDLNGRVITEGVGVDFVTLDSNPAKLTQKNISYYDNGNIKEEKYSVSQIVDGVEKIEDLGSKVSYDYNKDGNKISEITQKNKEEPINKVWSYDYNSSGNLYKATEKLSVLKSDLGTSESDVAGSTTITTVQTFNYNNKLVSEEVYENTLDNRKVVYGYDEFNNIIKEEKYTGTTLKSTVSRTFNIQNEVDTEIDEKGIKTTYTYDSRYNLLSKNNDFEKISYGYDYLGRVRWESNKLDQASTMDECGKLYNVNSSSDRYKSLYDINKDGVINLLDLVIIAKGSYIINKTNYHYNNSGYLIAKEKEYGDSITGQIKKDLIEGYKLDSEGRVLKQVSAKALAEVNGSMHDKINNAYGTEYVYDFQGEVISVKEPEDKAAVTVSYDNNSAINNKDKEIGRIKLEKHEKGSYKDTLDSFGNVKKTEVIEGGKTTVIESNNYDYLGNLISTIDGENNEYKFTYNNLGLLKTETLPGDESIDSNTIVHRYNAFGEEIFTKDSVGKLVITTRDYEGKVIREQIKSASFVTADKKVDITNSYDYVIKNGETIVTSTDGRGNKSEKVFDGIDRLISETTNVTDINGVPKKLTSNTKYFAGELVSEYTDPYNATTSNKYDIFGRVIEKRDANYNIIERLEYDKNGLQTKSIDALENTITFVYDRNNRLVEKIDAEGNSFKQTYDSNGNIATKTDARQNITSYLYDLRNRLLESKVQTKTGVDTYSYTYDENDNLLNVKDGANRVKQYTYNSLNLVDAFKEVELNGMNVNVKYIESYKYNSDQSLKSKNINNVEQITYKNDTLGRTIEEKSAKDTITTKYDKDGNVLEVKNSADTITRTFDELNRVKTKTSLGKTLKFAYDETDNISYGHHGETTTDFEGNVSKKIYDGAGRIVKSIDNGDTTELTYYPNGNKKSVKYASGVSEEYYYNKNNSLTTLVNKNGEKVISEYNYTYNANNLLETKKDSKGTTTYSYDKQNRLDSVKSPSNTISYTYDGAGNRKTETIVEGGTTTISTYEYSSTNKLEKVETKQGNTVTVTKTYLYDNKGNVSAELESTRGTVLTNISSKSIEESIKESNGRGILAADANQSLDTKSVDGDKYFYYSYDADNNMTEVKDEKGNLITSNKYNGEGLRVEKTTNNETAGYIYEGNNPIIELDGNKQIDSRNEYVGNTLLSRSINDLKYNYLYNGHGDVVNLVSEFGTIENTYYYDSFGNVEESEETVKNPFKYSKYEMDDETGLYYLKSRMYDPTTARFMQMDTYMGQTNDPLSLNLYTYCVNEPMMYYDPNGENPLAILGLFLAGGAIGLGAEYLGDKIDDGVVNTDSRHYLAAFITGGIELTARALVPIINIQPLSFGVDVGSYMLYQAIAGDQISIEEAALVASVGFGINGLGKVTSKAAKVGFNKVTDALGPKITPLITKYMPGLDTIIDIVSSKTKPLADSIKKYTNKAYTKYNNSLQETITSNKTLNSLYNMQLPTIKSAYNFIESKPQFVGYIENSVQGVSNPKYTSFRDLMSLEEVARYDKYWTGVAERISNEALDNQINFIKNGGITKPGGGAYKPAKISAAVDMNTGDISFGYNGANKFNPSRKTLKPELQTLIENTKSLAANDLTNPYSARNSYELWSVDNCAEVYATNNALRNGADIDNIFLNTKYFNNGVYAEPCGNCQITFKGVGMPNK